MNFWLINTSETLTAFANVVMIEISVDYANLDRHTPHLPLFSSPTQNIKR